MQKDSMLWWLKTPVYTHDQLGERLNPACVCWSGDGPLLAIRPKFQWDMYIIEIMVIIISVRVTLRISINQALFRLVHVI